MTNELDKIKEGRFAKSSEESKKDQFEYFEHFLTQMKDRLEKGFEKYGDFTITTNKDTAVEELVEELYDVANHAFLLAYRVKTLGTLIK